VTSIIKVSNLGKKYLISHNQPRRRSYRRFSEDVAAAFTWPARALRASMRPSANGHAGVKSNGVPRREEFWALRDIDFEVEQGEVVGIIGRNGAGKSTLLKLLSRITEPTTGRIELHGRVASLLEVGTGFHPELTGRENIFLNGAILGMTRSEIARKFDEIVAFAEVEMFLDTPVKRYSSGMHVRLAFAVAAHLEPEILVVDEVLAVGDAEFQKKCLGKMQEVSRGGRTVLFVSHNMGAIERLCSKSVLLKSGLLVSIGRTCDVIAQYVGDGASGSVSVWTNDAPETDEKVQLIKAMTCVENGSLSSVFRADQRICIALHASLRNSTIRAVFYVRVIDSIGRIVFTSWHTDGSPSTNWPNGGGTWWYVCHVPSRLLMPGVYDVSVGWFDHSRGSVVNHDRALRFEVAGAGYTLNAKRQGVIAPVLEWSVRSPESSDLELMPPTGG
jgi:lipopolysaccharide transport system ATP-binding protein